MDLGLNISDELKDLKENLEAYRCFYSKDIFHQLLDSEIKVRMSSQGFTHTQGCWRWGWVQRCWGRTSWREKQGVPHLWNIAVIFCSKTVAEREYIILNHFKENWELRRRWRLRLAVESSFVRRGDCLIFQMRNPELTSQAESVIPKSQG